MPFSVGTWRAKPSREPPMCTLAPADRSFRWGFLQIRPPAFVRKAFGGKMVAGGNLRKCRIPAGRPEVAFVIEPRVARVLSPRPGMRIRTSRTQRVNSCY